MLCSGCGCRHFSEWRPAYGETVLGIRYREKGRDGGWIAGPMIYLEKRLGCPGAAVLYGFFCIPAAFGMGSMVQANAISETVSYVYGIPEAAVGVILVVLAGIVLAGGGQRIFRAAERLVPLSAGLYTAAALAVIILYAGNVPGVILGILVDAFSFRSAVGGVAGYGISRCVSYGIARGVFSNEAGLGSLAVLNGSAEMASEELQGQWAIFEVFFDTIVSCTLTALVILCVAGSGTASEFGAENGASLTSLCFFTALGEPPAGMRWRSAWCCSRSPRSSHGTIWGGRRRSILAGRSRERSRQSMRWDIFWRRSSGASGRGRRCGRSRTSLMD